MRDMAWVGETCMTLEAARKERKLSQEQLDYELAKISLEFLDDYAFKIEPDKPFGLRRFEALRKEEIANMIAADYDKQKHEAEIQKSSWFRERGMIGAINGSNLRWLKSMKQILEKNNHAETENVQCLINEHEVNGVFA